MIMSGSIRMAPSGIAVALFWLSSIPLDTCATSFSVHVDGRCTGFHVLSVVSIAALNVGVHVSFEI